MESDNHPIDIRVWSILNHGDKVSFHPPAQSDWVGFIEIPRDQFNTIVDWYVKDQAIPPATTRAVVDSSLIRERISRAIFDPGQTEGIRRAKQTLTDWQTDAVMRVLGFADRPVDNSPVDNGESGD